jgi:hypothetical protein
MYGLLSLMRLTISEEHICVDDPVVKAKMYHVAVIDQSRGGHRLPWCRRDVVGRCVENCCGKSNTLAHSFDRLCLTLTIC